MWTEKNENFNRELSTLLKDAQNDKIGKIYFKKGVEFVLEGKHDVAWEFFKLGIDTVTCDCEEGFWLQLWLDSKFTYRGYQDASSELKSHIIKNYKKYNSYYFNMVFLLSYSQDDKSLKNIEDALSFLELTGGGNDYWYYSYLRSKMDEKNGIFNPESIESQIRDDDHEAYIDSGVLYRTGRSKRNSPHSNDSGISEIFLSFKLNPYSPCCAALLKEIMIEQGIKIEVSEKQESNPLLKAFIQDESKKSEFLSPSTFFDVYKRYLERFNSKKNQLEVKSFIAEVLSNFKILNPNKVSIAFYKNKHDPIKMLLSEEDYEFFKKHGRLPDTSLDQLEGGASSSQGKYGGYNGHSDDAIDDAFEGDQSLTWNIE